MYNFLSYDKLSTCSYPVTGKVTIPKKRVISRVRFTIKEDQELINVVSTFGSNNWNKISEELSKQAGFMKTAKQCRDRYLNYLSPNIQNKKEWTIEEDKCLIFYHLLYPNRWHFITQFLPGRSEVSIKNRYKQIENETMNYMRPIIQSEQKCKEIISDNIFELRTYFNQFNNSKNSLIRSIIDDSSQIYDKYIKNSLSKCKQVKNKSINDKKDALINDLFLK